ncbi:GNAT family N-acetyltransferase [Collimonas humicola]|uniref:GNAT family N-acetyltransferase n=1 Tax=Collimonas humicola TaxID=2825886 RepID=UPI001B8CC529|nr:GNAT family N-acetyltransferase [Collimonas humicola]
MKNSHPTDYFVSSLAIENRYRGKGFFNNMFEEIKNQAREKGSKRITLAVWEQSKALQIYFKAGFEIVDIFDYAYNLFFDKLYFLEYNLFDINTKK